MLRYTCYIRQFWAQKLLNLKVILNIQNCKQRNENINFLFLISNNIIL